MEEGRKEEREGEKERESGRGRKGEREWKREEESESGRG